MANANIGIFYLWTAVSEWGGRVSRASSAAGAGEEKIEKLFSLLRSRHPRPHKRTQFSIISSTAKFSQSQFRIAERFSVDYFGLGFCHPRRPDLDTFQSTFDSNWDIHLKFSCSCMQSRTTIPSDQVSSWLTCPKILSCPCSPPEHVFLSCLIFSCSPRKSSISFSVEEA